MGDLLVVLAGRLAISSRQRDSRELVAELGGGVKRERGLIALLGKDLATCSKRVAALFQTSRP